jgi:hypothetical protein
MPDETADPWTGGTEPFYGVVAMTGSWVEDFASGSALGWLFDRWGTSDSDIEIMNSALNPDADTVFVQIQAGAIDTSGYLINTQFITNRDPETAIDNFLIAGEVALCYDYHENFEAEYVAGMNQYFTVSDSGAPRVWFVEGIGESDITLRTDIAAPGSDPVGGWNKYTITYAGDEGAALQDRYGWTPGVSTTGYISNGFGALAASVSSTDLRSRFYYNTVKPTSKAINLDSLSIFSDIPAVEVDSTSPDLLTESGMPAIPIPIVYT